MTLSRHALQLSCFSRFGYFLLLFLTATPLIYAQPKELLINGDFESGMVDMELYRYPVYPRGDPVKVVDKAAISGRRSLLLPYRGKKSGYKFVFPMLLLDSSDIAEIAFKLRSDRPVTVMIDGFVRKKKIFRVNKRLQSGSNNYHYKIPENTVKTQQSPLSLVLWVKAKDDVIVDDISFISTAYFAQQTYAVLQTESPFGTFDIDEEAVMRLTVSDNQHYQYRILEQLSDVEIANGKVADDGRILLYTSKRGSYRVEVTSDDKTVKLWRLYAVINKKNVNAVKGGRYGVAMEEYGQRQMINAQLQGENWYQLATQIGVSDVRLFTAAMPDLISVNGVSYDFLSSDEMLKLSSRYKLEPLVELGSNTPERLPDWLRTTKGSMLNFNLSEGLRSKKLKNKFLKKMSAPYFDSDAYNKYLKTVFQHFDGQVQFYEIWNEPGHKFKPDDFRKIVSLTKKSRDKNSSTAKLAGFTSTKGGGYGHGEKTDLLPEFSDEMMALCQKCIDIFSYHSEHAFAFLGDSVDHENDENGFILRLKKLLTKYNSADTPIWDTERGIKWYSPHAENIDFIDGLQPATSGRVSVSVNEVARRLPGVHAAAFANGVQKLFWFYMNSGSMTSVRSHGRFGFFDSNLEPMPHLPAYDAMTELIADAEFIHLTDKLDGTRVYEFFNKQTRKTTLLIFNWKQKHSSLHIKTQNVHARLLDIYGNEAENTVIPDKGDIDLEVDGWPQYILFENSRNDTFIYN